MTMKDDLKEAFSYTPKPVVKQMVDDVHQELITKFGLKLGLADCSTYKSDGRTHYTVTILDPATGTGTFLEETIYKIHKTMMAFGVQKEIRRSLQSCGLNMLMTIFSTKFWI